MFDLGISVGKCRLVAHQEGGYAVPGATRPVTRMEALALAKRIDAALSASGRERSPASTGAGDGHCQRCGARDPSEVDYKCSIGGFDDRAGCAVWDW